MYDINGDLAIIDRESIRRIIVFGDIHGDLESLEWGMRNWGPNDLLLFLGDYADRGPSGVEVIESILAISDRAPGRTLILKGNHEDYGETGEPRFSPCTLMDEAARKRGSWEAFLPIFREFESRMSSAAILPGFALFTHAGIGPEINGPDDLIEPSSLVREHLIWSDPGLRRGVVPSPRGAGVLFGPDISASVLASLGVKFLIRSHQPRKATVSPAFDHRGRVVTLNSTRVYGGGSFVVELDTMGLPEKPKELRRLARLL
jgi:hypothetical protein